MKPSLPIQTTQVNLTPDLIDLGVGQPQLSLLPFHRLRQAAERCFEQRNSEVIQYGAEQGNGYLLQELATFLTRGYGFPTATENLFITNGASQGLDLVCTLYTQTADTIFVEEPSYFLALRIFADHHLRLVPIPVDEQGLSVDALEVELKRHHPKLLYTIPTFQNPSGRTLSAERRSRLATLSLEYNFWIVADEVYHFLNYTVHPPQPMASYIGQGNIISLGSFSKILAPGLRLGWIQADVASVKRLAHCGLLDSGGGLNPFTSAIVCYLLETNELVANIEELRVVYATRIKALDSALRQALPEVSYEVPQGGYFFWARLPGGRDAEVLMKRASENKVSFRSGVRFSSCGELRDYIRLSFAFYDVNQLNEGVKRLKNTLTG
jgi:2-aminoadipate transaminase